MSAPPPPARMSVVLGRHEKTRPARQLGLAWSACSRLDLAGGAVYRVLGLVHRTFGRVLHVAAGLARLALGLFHLVVGDLALDLLGLAGHLVAQTCHDRRLPSRLRATRALHRTHRPDKQSACRPLISARATAPSSLTGKRGPDGWHRHHYAPQRPHVYFLLAPCGRGGRG